MLSLVAPSGASAGGAETPYREAYARDRDRYRLEPYGGGIGTTDRLIIPFGASLVANQVKPIFERYFDTIKGFWDFFARFSNESACV